MIQDSLGKIKWGFFFIMLGFRIQGFDIFPDIVGYLLFAVALSRLRYESAYFSKAAGYNFPMIFLSIFTIYQAPAQGGGIQPGPWGMLGIMVSITSFILNLLTVYNIFMGIRVLEENREEMSLAEESEKRWNHYLLLQITVLFSFVLIFVPMLGFLYLLAVFAAAIAILAGIMGFLNKCIYSIDQVP